MVYGIGLKLLDFVTSFVKIVMGFKKINLILPEQLIH